LSTGCGARPRSHSAAADPAMAPWRSAVWIPPAVSGETSPAASPTSRTRSPNRRGRTPPHGIMPARMPLGRSRAFPDQRRETIEQPHHVGRVAQGVPARDAELQRADALERPADVAGGQTAVDEAVQRVGVVQPGAGKFELDAGEEFAVAAQSAEAGDLRVRAVGADEVAGSKRPVDDPAGR